MNLSSITQRLRLLIAVAAILTAAIVPSFFPQADAAEMPRSSGQAAHGTLSFIAPTQLAPSTSLTATTPLSAPTTAYLPLVKTAPPLSPFAEKSRDLINMNLDGLFQRPDNRLVTFDIEAARAAGYAEPSIVLASELTNFTNDLILATEQADEDAAVVWTTYERASTYTNMVAYFHEANNPDNWMDEKDLERFGKSLKSPIPGIAEWVCGTWIRPRPWGAPKWQEHIYSPTPAQDLMRMGFHAPPNWLPAIGWTRPVTYEPLICGLETFRDNGAVQARQELALQLYAGWEHPGEPNPEVWRTGLPYPHWPAYVAWWHWTF